MLTQNSLAPIRNDNPASMCVHRPHRAAQRSRNTASDPARGAGRDRAATASTRRLETQPLRPAIGEAGRRNIATGDRGSGTVGGRKDGRTGSRGQAARSEAQTAAPMAHRRSAIAARFPRICRGSRSSWISRTKPVPVAAVCCIRSARTRLRCWITSPLSSGCG